MRIDRFVLAVCVVAAVVGGLLGCTRSVTGAGTQDIDQFASTYRESEMVRFALACAIALAPLALLAVPKRVARGTALQLGHDGAGPRHFLAGRAVHAGTPLLLMMADGSSIAGRYQNRQFDDGTLLGRFHFEVRNDPAAGIAYSEAAIDLPPDAELRWP